MKPFDDNLDFSFPINGSSMQPFLYKDDIVRLRKCHMAYPGDIVFISMVIIIYYTG